MIPNCKNYVFNRDICALCDETHYLNETSSACEILPVGIPGCEIYTDDKNCKSCKPKTYLANNSCLEIISENEIANCLYYSNKDTCSQCDNTHILEGNICVEKKTQCLTYYNAEECESCPDGEAIFVESGKRICKTYTAIPNCSSHTGVAPVSCLKCQNGFFLNASSNSCNPDNTIEFCLEYEGASLCAKCDTNKILSLDKKKCEDTNLIAVSQCSHF